MRTEVMGVDWELEEAVELQRMFWERTKSARGIARNREAGAGNIVD
jgi:hypothetical protein